MRQEDITRIYDRNARWYDLMQAPMERLGARRWRANLLDGVAGDVLEVGVGTGKNLPLYERDAVVTAIDPSIRMLDQARQHASAASVGAEFVQAQAERLPFDGASFDAVVASFVFCSVTDPLAGLREARRVLRPGGELRLLEHQRPSGHALARLFDVLDPLARRLTGASINRPTEENVRRAGFGGVTAQHLDRFGIVRLITARAPVVPAAEGGPHAE
jgi:ubiquinone/menaquinone biosynthesis C-methylase UbiE